MFDITITGKIVLFVALPTTFVLLYLLLRRTDVRQRILRRWKLTTDKSVSSGQKLTTDEEEEEEDTTSKGRSSRQSVIELKVPTYAVSAVIGQEGTTIKKIEKSSRAKIEIKENEDRSDEEKTLLIKGHTKAVQKAELTIRSIIADVPIIISEDIYVPNSCTRFLLGKQGETIQMIKRVSGANIIMDRVKINDPTYMRLVSLTGTREQNEQAKKLINEKIDEFETFHTSSDSVRLQESKIPLAEETTETTQMPPVREKWDIESEQGLPPLRNQRRDVLEMMVVAAENPGHFWGHICNENLTKLIQLQNELEAFYGKSEELEACRISEAAKNDIVAVCLDNGTKWFRARITEVLDDGYQVFCVDYGYREVVSKCDIRKLCGSFLSLPFQALECYLANIKPTDNENWSKSATEMFENMVCINQSKVISGDIMNYQRTSHGLVPCLNLIDYNGPQVSWCNLWLRASPKHVPAKGTININEELVQMGHAEWDEASDPGQMFKDDLSADISHKVLTREGSGSIESLNDPFLKFPPEEKHKIPSPPADAEWADDFPYAWAYNEEESTSRGDVCEIETCLSKKDSPTREITQPGAGGINSLQETHTLPKETSESSYSMTGYDEENRASKTDDTKDLSGSLFYNGICSDVDRSLPASSDSPSISHPDGYSVRVPTTEDSTLCPILTEDMYIDRKEEILTSADDDTLITSSQIDSKRSQVRDIDTLTDQQGRTLSNKSLDRSNTTSLGSQQEFCSSLDVLEKPKTSTSELTNISREEDSSAIVTLQDDHTTKLPSVEVPGGEELALEESEYSVSISHDTSTSGQDRDEENELKGREGLHSNLGTKGDKDEGKGGTVVSRRDPNVLTDINANRSGENLEREQALSCSSLSHPGEHERLLNQNAKASEQSTSQILPEAEATASGNAQISITTDLGISDNVQSTRNQSEVNDRCVLGTTDDDSKTSDLTTDKMKIAKEFQTQTVSEISGTESHKIDELSEITDTESCEKLKESGFLSVVPGLCLDETSSTLDYSQTEPLDIPIPSMYSEISPAPCPTILDPTHTIPLPLVTTLAQPTLNVELSSSADLTTEVCADLKSINVVDESDLTKNVHHAHVTESEINVILPHVEDVPSSGSQRELSPEVFGQGVVTRTASESKDTHSGQYQHVQSLPSIDKTLKDKWAMLYSPLEEDDDWKVKTELTIGQETQRPVSKTQQSSESLETVSEPLEKDTHTDDIWKFYYTPVSDKERYSEDVGSMSEEAEYSKEGYDAHKSWGTDLDKSLSKDQNVFPEDWKHTLSEPLEDDETDFYISSLSEYMTSERKDTLPSIDEQKTSQQDLKQTEEKEGLSMEEDRNAITETEDSRRDKTSINVSSDEKSTVNADNVKGGEQIPVNSIGSPDSELHQEETLKGDDSERRVSIERQPGPKELESPQSNVDTETESKLIPKSVADEKQKSDLEYSVLEEDDWQEGDRTEKTQSEKAEVVKMLQQDWRQTKSDPLEEETDDWLSFYSPVCEDSETIDPESVPDIGAKQDPTQYSGLEEDEWQEGERPKVQCGKAMSSMKTFQKQWKETTSDSLEEETDLLESSSRTLVEPPMAPMTIECEKQPTDIEYATLEEDEWEEGEKIKIKKDGEKPVEEKTFQKNWKDTKSDPLEEETNDWISFYSPVCEDSETIDPESVPDIGVKQDPNQYSGLEEDEWQEGERPKVQCGKAMSSMKTFQKQWKETTSDSLEEETDLLESSSRTLVEPPMAPMTIECEKQPTDIEYATLEEDEWEEGEKIKIKKDGEKPVEEKTFQKNWKDTKSDPLEEETNDWISFYSPVCEDSETIDPESVPDIGVKQDPNQYSGLEEDEWQEGERPKVQCGKAMSSMKTFQKQWKETTSDSLEEETDLLESSSRTLVEPPMAPMTIECEKQPTDIEYATLEEDEWEEGEKIKIKKDGEKPVEEKTFQKNWKDTKSDPLEEETNDWISFYSPVCEDSETIDPESVPDIGVKQDLTQYSGLEEDEWQEGERPKVQCGKAMSSMKTFQKQWKETTSDSLEEETDLLESSSRTLVEPPMAPMTIECEKQPTDIEYATLEEDEWEEGEKIKIKKDGEKPVEEKTFQKNWKDTKSDPLEEETNDWISFYSPVCEDSETIDPESVPDIGVKQDPTQYSGLEEDEWQEGERPQIKYDKEMSSVKTFQNQWKETTSDSLEEETDLLESSSRTLVEPPMAPMTIECDDQTKDMEYSTLEDDEWEEGARGESLESGERPIEEKTFQRNWKETKSDSLEEGEGDWLSFYSPVSEESDVSVLGTVNDSTLMEDPHFEHFDYNDEDDWKEREETIRKCESRKSPPMETFQQNWKETISDSLDEETLQTSGASDKQSEETFASPLEDKHLIVPPGHKSEISYSSSEGECPHYISEDGKDSDNFREVGNVSQQDGKTSTDEFPYIQYEKASSVEDSMSESNGSLEEEEYEESDEILSDSERLSSEDDEPPVAEETNLTMVNSQTEAGYSSSKSDYMSEESEEEEYEDEDNFTASDSQSSGEADFETGLIESVEEHYVSETSDQENTDPPCPASELSLHEETVSQTIELPVAEAEAILSDKSGQSDEDRSLSEIEDERGGTEILDAENGACKEIKPTSGVVLRKESQSSSGSLPESEPSRISDMTETGIELSEKIQDEIKDKEIPEDQIIIPDSSGLGISPEETQEEDGDNYKLPAETVRETVSVGQSRSHSPSGSWSKMEQSAGIDNSQSDTGLLDGSVVQFGESQATDLFQVTSEVSLEETGIPQEESSIELEKSKGEFSPEEGMTKLKQEMPKALLEKIFQEGWNETRSDPLEEETDWLSFYSPSTEDVDLVENDYETNDVQDTCPVYPTQYEDEIIENNSDKDDTEFVDAVEEQKEFWYLASSTFSLDSYDEKQDRCDNVKEMDEDYGVYAVDENENGSIGQKNLVDSDFETGMDWKETESDPLEEGFEYSWIGRKGDVATDLKEKLYEDPSNYSSLNEDTDWEEMSLTSPQPISKQAEAKTFDPNWKETVSDPLDEDEGSPLSILQPELGKQERREDVLKLNEELIGSQFQRDAQLIEESQREISLNGRSEENIAEAKKEEIKTEAGIVKDDEEKLTEDTRGLFVAEKHIQVVEDLTYMQSMDKESVTLQSLAPEEDEWLEKDESIEKTATSGEMPVKLSGDVWRQTESDPIEMECTLSPFSSPDREDEEVIDTESLPGPEGREDPTQYSGLEEDDWQEGERPQIKYDKEMSSVKTFQKQWKETTSDSLEEETDLLESSSRTLVEPPMAPMTIECDDQTKDIEYATLEEDEWEEGEKIKIKKDGEKPVEEKTFQKNWKDTKSDPLEEETNDWLSFYSPVCEDSETIDPESVPDIGVKQDPNQYSGLEEDEWQEGERPKVQCGKAMSSMKTFQKQWKETTSDSLEEETDLLESSSRTLVEPPMAPMTIECEKQPTDIEYATLEEDEWEEGEKIKIKKDGEKPVEEKTFQKNWKDTKSDPLEEETNDWLSFYSPVCEDSETIDPESVPDMGVKPDSTQYSGLEEDEWQEGERPEIKYDKEMSDLKTFQKEWKDTTSDSLEEETDLLESSVRTLVEPTPKPMTIECDDQSKDIEYATLEEDEWEEGEKRKIKEDGEKPVEEKTFQKNWKDTKSDPLEEETNDWLSFYSPVCEDSETIDPESVPDMGVKQDPNQYSGLEEDEWQEGERPKVQYSNELISTDCSNKDWKETVSEPLEEGGNWNSFYSPTMDDKDLVAPELTKDTVRAEKDVELPDNQTEEHSESEEKKKDLFTIKADEKDKGVDTAEEEDWLSYYSAYSTDVEDIEMVDAQSQLDVTEKHEAREEIADQELSFIEIQESPEGIKEKTELSMMEPLAESKLIPMPVADEKDKSHMEYSVLEEDDWQEGDRTEKTQSEKAEVVKMLQQDWRQTKSDPLEEETDDWLSFYSPVCEDSETIDPESVPDIGVKQDTTQYSGLEEDEWQEGERPQIKYDKEMSTMKTFQKQWKETTSDSLEEETDLLESSSRTLVEPPMAPTTIEDEKEPTDIEYATLEEDEWEEGEKIKIKKDGEKPVEEKTFQKNWKDTKSDPLEEETGDWLSFYSPVCEDSETIEPESVPDMGENHDPTQYSGLEEDEWQEGERPKVQCGKAMSSMKTFQKQWKETTSDSLEEETDLLESSSRTLVEPPIVPMTIECDDQTKDIEYATLEEDEWEEGEKIKIKKDGEKPVEEKTFQKNWKDTKSEPLEEETVDWLSFYSPVCEDSETIDPESVPDIGVKQDPTQYSGLEEDEWQEGERPKVQCGKAMSSMKTFQKQWKETTSDSLEEETDLLESSSRTLVEPPMAPMTIECEKQPTDIEYATLEEDEWEEGEKIKIKKDGEKPVEEKTFQKNWKDTKSDPLEEDDSCVPSLQEDLEMQLNRLNSTLSTVTVSEPLEHELCTLSSHDHSVSNSVHSLIKSSFSDSLDEERNDVSPLVTSSYSDQDDNIDDVMDEEKSLVSTAVNTDDKDVWGMYFTSLDDANDEWNGCNEESCFQNAPQTCQPVASSEDFSWEIREQIAQSLPQQSKTASYQSQPKFFSNSLDSWVSSGTGTLVTATPGDMSTPVFSDDDDNEYIDAEDSFQDVQHSSDPHDVSTEKNLLNGSALQEGVTASLDHEALARRQFIEEEISLLLSEIVAMATEESRCMEKGKLSKQDLKAESSKISQQITELIHGMVVSNEGVEKSNEEYNVPQLSNVSTRDINELATYTDVTPREVTFSDELQVTENEPDLKSCSLHVTQRMEEKLQNIATLYSNYAEEIPDTQLMLKLDTLYFIEKLGRDKEKPSPPENLPSLEATLSAGTDMIGPSTEAAASSESIDSCSRSSVPEVSESTNEQLLDLSQVETTSKSPVSENDEIFANVLMVELPSAEELSVSGQINSFDASNHDCETRRFTSVLEVSLPEGPTNENRELTPSKIVPESKKMKLKKKRLSPGDRIVRRWRKKYPYRNYSNALFVNIPSFEESSNVEFWKKMSRTCVEPNSDLEDFQKDKKMVQRRISEAGFPIETQSELLLRIPPNDSNSSWKSKFRCSLHTFVSDYDKKHFHNVFVIPKQHEKYSTEINMDINRRILADSAGQESENSEEVSESRAETVHTPDMDTSALSSSCVPRNETVAESKPLIQEKTTIILQDQLKMEEKEPERKNSVVIDFATSDVSNDKMSYFTEDQIQNLLQKITQEASVSHYSKTAIFNDPYHFEDSYRYGVNGSHLGLMDPSGEIYYDAKSEPDKTMLSTYSEMLLSSNIISPETVEKEKKENCQVRAASTDSEGYMTTEEKSESELQMTQTSERLAMDLSSLLSVDSAELSSELSKSYACDRPNSPEDQSISTSSSDSEGDYPASQHLILEFGSEKESRKSQASDQNDEADIETALSEPSLTELEPGSESSFELSSSTAEPVTTEIKSTEQPVEVVALEADSSKKSDEIPSIQTTEIADESQELPKFCKESVIQEKTIMEVSLFGEKHMVSSTDELKILVESHDLNIEDFSSIKLSPNSQLDCFSELSFGGASSVDLDELLHQKNLVPEVCESSSKEKDKQKDLVSTCVDRKEEFSLVDLPKQIEKSVSEYCLESRKSLTNGTCLPLPDGFPFGIGKPNIDDTEQQDTNEERSAKPEMAETGPNSDLPVADGAENKTETSKTEDTSSTVTVDDELPEPGNNVKIDTKIPSSVKDEEGSDGALFEALDKGKKKKKKKSKFFALDNEVLMSLRDTAEVMQNEEEDTQVDDISQPSPEQVETSPKGYDGDLEAKESVAEPKHILSKDNQQKTDSSLYHSVMKESEISEIVALDIPASTILKDNSILIEPKEMDKTEVQPDKYSLVDQTEISVSDQDHLITSELESAQEKAEMKIKEVSALAEPEVEPCMNSQVDQTEVNLFDQELTATPELESAQEKAEMKIKEVSAVAVTEVEPSTNYRVDQTEVALSDQDLTVALEFESTHEKAEMKIKELSALTEPEIEPCTNSQVDQTEVNLFDQDLTVTPELESAQENAEMKIKELSAVAVPEFEPSTNSQVDQTEVALFDQGLNITTELELTQERAEMKIKELSAVAVTEVEHSTNYRVDQTEVALFNQDFTIAPEFESAQEKAEMKIKELSALTEPEIEPCTNSQVDQTEVNLFDQDLTITPELESAQEKAEMKIKEVSAVAVPEVEPSTNSQVDQTEDTLFDQGLNITTELELTQERAEININTGSALIEPEIEPCTETQIDQSEFSLLDQDLNITFQIESAQDKAEISINKESAFAETQVEPCTNSQVDQAEVSPFDQDVIITPDLELAEERAEMSVNTGSAFAEPEVEPCSSSQVDQIEVSPFDQDVIVTPELESAQERAEANISEGASLMEPEIEPSRNSQVDQIEVSPFDQALLATSEFESAEQKRADVNVYPGSVLAVSEVEPCENCHVSPTEVSQSDQALLTTSKLESAVEENVKVNMNEGPVLSRIEARAFPKSLVDQTEVADQNMFIAYEFESPREESLECKTEKQVLCEIENQVIPPVILSSNNLPEDIQSNEELSLLSTQDQESQEMCATQTSIPSTDSCDQVSRHLPSDNVAKVESLYSQDDQMVFEQQTMTQQSETIPLSSAAESHQKKLTSQNELEQTVPELSSACSDQRAFLQKTDHAGATEILQSTFAGMAEKITDEKIKRKKKKKKKSPFLYGNSEESIRSPHIREYVISDSDNEAGNKQSSVERDAESHLQTTPEYAEVCLSETSTTAEVTPADKDTTDFTTVDKDVTTTDKEATRMADITPAGEKATAVTHVGVTPTVDDVTGVMTKDRNGSDVITRSKDTSHVTSRDEGVIDITTIDKHVTDVTTKDRNGSDVITRSKDVSHVTSRDEGVIDITTIDKHVTDVTVRSEDVIDVTPTDNDVPEIVECVTGVTTRYEDVTDVITKTEDVTNVITRDEVVSDVTTKDEDVTDVTVDKDTSEVAGGARVEEDTTKRVKEGHVEKCKGGKKETKEMPKKKESLKMEKAKGARSSKSREKEIFKEMSTSLKAGDVKESFDAPVVESPRVSEKPGTGAVEYSTKDSKKKKKRKKSSIKETVNTAGEILAPEDRQTSSSVAVPTPEQVVLEKSKEVTRTEKSSEMASAMKEVAGGKITKAEECRSGFLFERTYPSVDRQVSSEEELQKEFSLEPTDDKTDESIYNLLPSETEIDVRTDKASIQEELKGEFTTEETPGTKVGDTMMDSSLQEKDQTVKEKRQESSFKKASISKTKKSSQEHKTVAKSATDLVEKSVPKKSETQMPTHLGTKAKCPVSQSETPAASKIKFSTNRTNLAEEKKKTDRPQRIVRRPSPVDVSVESSAFVELNKDEVLLMASSDEAAKKVTSFHEEATLPENESPKMKMKLSEHKKTRRSPFPYGDGNKSLLSKGIEEFFQSDDGIPKTTDTEKSIPCPAKKSPKKTDTVPRYSRSIEAMYSEEVAPESFEDLIGNLSNKGYQSQTVTTKVSQEEFYRKSQETKEAVSSVPSRCSHIIKDTVAETSTTEIDTKVEKESPPLNTKSSSSESIVSQALSKVSSLISKKTSSASEDGSPKRKSTGSSSEENTHSSPPLSQKSDSSSSLNTGILTLSKKKNQKNVESASEKISVKTSTTDSQEAPVSFKSTSSSGEDLSTKDTPKEVSSPETVLGSTGKKEKMEVPKIAKNVVEKISSLVTSITKQVTESIEELSTHKKKKLKQSSLSQTETKNKQDAKQEFGKTQKQKLDKNTKNATESKNRSKGIFAGSQLLSIQQSSRKTPSPAVSRKRGQKQQQQQQSSSRRDRQNIPLSTITIESPHREHTYLPLINHLTEEEAAFSDTTPQIKRKKKKKKRKERNLSQLSTATESSCEIDIVLSADSNRRSTQDLSVKKKTRATQPRITISESRTIKPECWQSSMTNLTDEVKKEATPIQYLSSDNLSHTRSRSRSHRSPAKELLWLSEQDFLSDSRETETSRRARSQSHINRFSKINLAYIPTGTRKRKRRKKNIIAV